MDEATKKIYEREISADIAATVGGGAPVVVVDGMRGVGKTTTVLATLRSLGIAFGYVSLDDSSLYSLTRQGYAPLVDAVAEACGHPALVVIDEVLSHPRWLECVSAFAGRGIQVVAIASGDVSDQQPPPEAALLHMYPLSFAEFCRWHEAEASLAAYDQYLHRGGLPALQDKQRPRAAAKRILDAALKLDIRGDVRKGSAPQLRALADYLIDDNGQLLNYKRIAEHFGMRSEITLKKYIDAVKRSGVLAPLMRFSMNDKVRNIYEKVYVADTALLPQYGLQAAMETAVHMQLKRLCDREGMRMHYYANRSAECNFALCRDRRMRTIIQVMADYGDSAAVREKVAGLINLSKTTGSERLYILTHDSRDQLTERGLQITVMPAWQF